MSPRQRSHRPGQFAASWRCGGCCISDRRMDVTWRVRSPLHDDAPEVDAAAQALAGQVCAVHHRDGTPAKQSFAGRCCGRRPAMASSPEWSYQSRRAHCICRIEAGDQGARRRTRSVAWAKRRVTEAAARAEQSAAKDLLLLAAKLDW